MRTAPRHEGSRYAHPFGYYLPLSTPARQYFCKHPERLSQYLAPAAVWRVAVQLQLALQCVFQPHLPQFDGDQFFWNLSVEDKADRSLPMIPRREWSCMTQQRCLQRHSLVRRQHLSYLDQKETTFRLLTKAPQRLISSFGQQSFPSRFPVFLIRPPQTDRLCCRFDQGHQIAQRLFSTWPATPHCFAECIDMPPCYGHEGNAWVIECSQALLNFCAAWPKARLQPGYSKLPPGHTVAAARPNRGGGYRLFLLERSPHRSETKTSYEIPS